jgi:demethylmenaquinone methyltransferase/2-methoxy-6-polyprenyl-1,4-benzoquinol methylase
MKQQHIYYKKRASEYDLVYKKPERQVALQLIKEYLANQFHHKRLIEIACGTGYWTKILIQNAKSIFAIDINEDVIDLAKNKEFNQKEILFEVIDLYDLEKRKEKFDGLFAGFIWSHIKKEALATFLQICLDQVQANGELIFIDNKFVKGSSTPISKEDAYGNTFQKRKLKSGEVFEIIKNFPTKKEISTLIEPICSEFEYVEFEYYWLIKFRKK